MTLMIVNPAGAPPELSHRLAVRPAELTGLRLGVLDNGKANADMLLHALSAKLTARFGVVETAYLSRRQPGMDHRKRRPGEYDEFLEILTQQCDVVINGVGD
jgi:hypothetical protein